MPPWWWTDCFLPFPNYPVTTLLWIGPLLKSLSIVYHQGQGRAEIYKVVGAFLHQINGLKLLQELIIATIKIKLVQNWCICQAGGSQG